MQIRFTVPGKPVPQKRPIVLRRGWTIDPPESVKAKRSVAQYALEARCSSGTMVLDCPVSLRLWFYGLRPNADLSNALKLIEDACNGVLWKDDKQIFRLEVTREACTKGQERTDVEVTWQAG